MAGDSPFDPAPLIGDLPNFKHYNGMYAQSIEYDDERALRMLRDFEPVERLRGLQTELQWVKAGRVCPKFLRLALGTRRLARFQTPTHWAEWMLQILAQQSRSDS